MIIFSTKKVDGYENPSQLTIIRDDNGQWSYYGRKTEYKAVNINSPRELGEIMREWVSFYPPRFVKSGPYNGPFKTIN